MKKSIIFSLCFLSAIISLSCNKSDDDPSVVIETNQDKFNIIFNLNFNKDSTGAYNEEQWETNWNFPTWANRKHGYGTIVKESTNKYLMQSFVPGAWLSSDGYQWHTKFSQGYDELYLSYRVKFSGAFLSRDLHGKLPGLSGGASNGGGDLPTGDDGWSARYMFHGTSINFYLYHPDIYKDAGDAIPVAGKSYYGRGPELYPGFTLKTDTWYTVTQRIVMNTPGQTDGLVEGFIDGKLCAVKTGIRFRDIATLQIDRIYFANFFGGSGVKPTENGSVSFDDFVVYTYDSSVNVARNNDANPAGTTILLPNLPQ